MPESKRMFCRTVFRRRPRSRRIDQPTVFETGRTLDPAPTQKFNDVTIDRVANDKPLVDPQAFRLSRFSDGTKIELDGGF
jgi:hypothetical protein